MGRIYEIKKFIAYYEGDHEHEFFDTLNQAKEWLENYSVDVADGGINVDALSNSYICEIDTVWEPEYKETEQRKDYCSVDCDQYEKMMECDYDENMNAIGLPEQCKKCNKEEWPYGDSWDHIGEIKYIETTKKGEKE